MPPILLRRHLQLQLPQGGRPQIPTGQRRPNGQAPQGEEGCHRVVQEQQEALGPKFRVRGEVDEHPFPRQSTTASPRPITPTPTPPKRKQSPTITSSSRPSRPTKKQRTAPRATWSSLAQSDVKITDAGKYINPDGDASDPGTSPDHQPAAATAAATTPTPCHAPSAAAAATSFKQGTPNTNPTA